MNNIKRWEDRCAYQNPAAEFDSAKLAFACIEIAELRAALAARATPAQPDSKLLVDIATGVMEERSMLSDMNEDHVQLFCDHLKEAFDRAAFIPSPASASPSTVAEAIRKLPLGRPANEAVFADGTTHIFIYKDSQRVYTEATVRRLLSEAAALAEGK